MAGRGSRFTENGYTDSKPFIDVNGKPMIQRVIENLNIKFDDQYEFVIICLQEDYDKYDFGVYAIGDYEINDQWQLEAGVRFVFKEKRLQGHIGGKRMVRMIPL